MGLANVRDVAQRIHGYVLTEYKKPKKDKDGLGHDIHIVKEIVRRIPRGIWKCRIGKQRYLE